MMSIYLSRLIIPCIILTPVLLCLSFSFDLLGFSKIQSLLLQTGLRALFRLVGWEVPLMIILCVLSGLESGYTLHMISQKNSEKGGQSPQ